jgi:hypothetical protein
MLSHRKTCCAGGPIPRRPQRERRHRIRGDAREVSIAVCSHLHLVDHLPMAATGYRRGIRRPRNPQTGRYAVFSQTDTCDVLPVVKGWRVQSLQRSRRDIPASRAMRSSSDGHT